MMNQEIGLGYDEPRNRTIMMNQEIELGYDEPRNRTRI